MIKKIIVSTILIVLLVGILGIGYLKINNPKEETINTEITKNISKEDKEESTDEIIVDEKIEEIETPKNNNKDEEKNTTPKKEDKKEQKSSSESKNNTTITCTDTNKQNNNEVKEATQPKKETEWEKLGISEYDYYHKPMWSWARVDYKVEDYGSLEKAHQACIDDGNKIEDSISFSCTNINSYSGDYLGDMLKVKY
mgnify:FL=1